jgi:hypothetical protein
MKNYINTWIKHHGDRPKDKHGDNYDIHHIIAISKGGTNDIDNLVALSREAHIAIHLAQGDILAARLLGDHVYRSGYKRPDQSEFMKKHNPMFNPETAAKTAATLRGQTSRCKGRVYTGEDKIRLYPKASCVSCRASGNVRGITQWHINKGCNKRAES